MDDLDLSEAIVPRSDQLNAEDLLTGWVDVTIERVTKVKGEQPVHIHLVEFPGRPWKPSKSMLRVLVNAWGKNGSVYVGRRARLYRDPDVKYAGDAVGGIKTSHLSHLSKPLTLALTVTRGKRAPHTVEPLPSAGPVEPTAEEVAACDDVEALKAMYRAARTDERKSQITARAAELTTTEGETP